MKFSILNKVNVFNVVKKHLKTLKNTNTGKSDFDDYLTFLIIPLVIAGILLWRNSLIEPNLVSIIITALSIFVGLFFNVIILIFDMTRRDKVKEIKIEILRQLQANISYVILLSLITIIVILFTYFENTIVSIIANGISYFLLIHLIMTILMVIKRTFRLLEEEIKDSNKR